MIMTQHEKLDLYFHWLLRIVCNSVKARKYERVLRQLFDTPFRWTDEQPMDYNRTEDGIILRTEFKQEHGFLVPMVECSVLELMIALARRCEVDVMHDDSLGDRTGQWFWEMFASLGLTNKSDDGDVYWCLERFMDRTYDPSGAGGLFIVNDPDIDMRDLEIWAQMNVYLNTII